MAPESVPPKTLEDNWPGLEAERDGVIYNEKVIRESAKALREALGRFIGEGGSAKGSGLAAGQGSIEDLTAYTALDELRTQLQSVARWEGGRTFAKMLETCHQEFTTIYQEVQKSFDTAIALIDAGAGKYTDVSDANTGGA
ncbi:hypothetical protein ABT294_49090 [Nonomuraea sp. NPDC000554]|uniref:hypothetical protein n=1 Tax=Nonomuraea sp. NPDC000554 TaxID=3154259 RepID=UPI00333178C9